MCDFMNEEQISYFKTLLEKQRDEIIERMNNHAADAVSSDTNEMADEVDRAAIEETRRLELNRQEHDQIHLRKLKAALHRIDEGEFGYCEDCGEEIAIKRLQARPESRLCVECQSTKEFSDNFVFEPGLDPATTPQQLAELSAAGIRAIYMLGPSGPVFTWEDFEWGDSCMPCSDYDGDTRCVQAPQADCDDKDPGVWATPGEVQGLILAKGPSGTVLSWNPPAEPGATTVAYDVLRATNPASFLLETTCVAGLDVFATTRVDAVDPAVGMFAYLVRATNGCPKGAGDLGAGTNDPRAGRPCS